MNFAGHSGLNVYIYIYMYLYQFINQETKIHGDYQETFGIFGNHESQIGVLNLEGEFRWYGFHDSQPEKPAGLS